MSPFSELLVIFWPLSSWNKNLLRLSTRKQNEYKQMKAPSWRLPWGQRHYRRKDLWPLDISANQLQCQEILIKPNFCFLIRLSIIELNPLRNVSKILFKSLFLSLNFNSNEWDDWQFFFNQGFNISNILFLTLRILIIKNSGSDLAKTKTWFHSFYWLGKIFSCGHS